MSETLKSLISMARLGGLGPPTCGLEVRCSIQLSYRRNVLSCLLLHYLFKNIIKNYLIINISKKPGLKTGKNLLLVLDPMKIVGVCL